MANKAWHRDPLFKRLRAVVIPRAYADPGYRCPTCHRTLDEVRHQTPTARWDCDHVIPGSLAAGVRARCSPCNRADGARMTNTTRASGYNW